MSGTVSSSSFMFSSSLSQASVSLFSALKECIRPFIEPQSSQIHYHHHHHHHHNMNDGEPIQLLDHDGVRLWLNIYTVKEEDTVVRIKITYQHSCPYDILDHYRNFETLFTSKVVECVLNMEEEEREREESKGEDTLIEKEKRRVGVEAIKRQLCEEGEMVILSSSDPEKAKKKNNKRKRDPLVIYFSFSVKSPDDLTPLYCKLQFLSSLRVACYFPLFQPFLTSPTERGPICIPSSQDIVLLHKERVEGLANTTVVTTRLTVPENHQSQKGLRHAVVERYLQHMMESDINHEGFRFVYCKAPFPPFDLEGLEHEEGDEGETSLQKRFWCSFYIQPGWLPSGPSKAPGRNSNSSNHHHPSPTDWRRLFTFVKRVMDFRRTVMEFLQRYEMYLRSTIRCRIERIRESLSKEEEEKPFGHMMIPL